MAVDEKSFSVLALTEQDERWKQDRTFAERRLGALDGPDRIVQSYTSSLADALQSGRTFYSPKDFHDLARRVAETHGLTPESTAALTEDGVLTLLVSRALGQVLGSSEPSEELLATIAGIEFYTDTEVLLESFKRAPRAANWLQHILTQSVAIQSINDDELRAFDEIESWNTEKARPFPRWRFGDIPLRGTEVLSFSSEILRTLDEQAWLEFVDRQPLPALMELMLWTAHVEQAPALLLEWIRRAPSAFDSTGGRTTSALVFVLERKCCFVLEEALLRRNSWQADPPVPNLIESADYAIQELASAIHERPDAETLLAELAAARLVNAQRTMGESRAGGILQELQLRLGNAYAAKLDSPARLKARAEVDLGRSGLGFWLAAAVAGSFEQPSPSPSSDKEPDLWEWFVELVTAPDPEIADPYRQPAQWVLWHAGGALVSQADPLLALEDAWNSIAEKRLAGTHDSQPNTGWVASRFVARVAFVGFARCADTTVSAHLWRAGMEMAVTCWMSAGGLDPFAEVSFGLGHLAKAGKCVDGEPAGTFQYLVGLPQEVAWAVLALATNGMEAERVIQAVDAVGLDIGLYLNLVKGTSVRNLTEKETLVLAGLQRMAGDVDRGIGRAQEAMTSDIGGGA